LPHKTLHFAANIAQQSNRLHELVRRLLELSRLEKDPLNKQPLDIAALWHKLVHAQQARLAQKHLSLHENITEEKPLPRGRFPRGHPAGRTGVGVAKKRLLMRQCTT